MVIQVQKLGKTYATSSNPLVALDKISFSILEGEFVSLVGPSGCGKSTVLKIIAGLEDKTSGEVQKPKEVAMVFQNGALMPWLTVFDNVALGLKAEDASQRKIQEECGKYIEMMGLTSLAFKYPHELSGGQRQRVGFARALAVSPKILLLDEPFSALDAATTEELHKDLYKIWQATKKTIVMVSHSIEEAVGLADRIMLMKEGTIQKIYEINLSHPRREQGENFMKDVQKIRGEFFK